VLAPWIDERFVLGLPLALCVRWAHFERTGENFSAWARREALAPMVLVVLFSLVRLGLGGSGGSQTVGAYLDRFVFGRELKFSRALFGAWEGLRVGWLLVLVVGIAALRARRTRPIDVRLPLVLAFAAGSTVVGLLTALDLSRSMVLVLPVVPLGWMLAQSSRWWRALHLAPLLAIAALLLPAHHVVSRFVLPVAPLWAGPDLSENYAHLAGIYASGQGGPKDSAAALRWYRKAAEIGGAEHKYNLGLALEQGQGGPPDYAEAAKWYRLAAEQGNLLAQNNLGSLYNRGLGVPRDNVEAAKWLRLAAQRGSAMAQSNLADLLAHGDGVAKDPVEAAQWYRLAANQDNAAAQCALGSMYAMGSGVAQDESIAVGWFRKAAAQGYPLAQANLGVMYANGSGVAKNEVEALAWFYVAATHDASAASYRDLLLQRLTPSSIQAARHRSQELFKP
jgi:TPR repeat protein